MAFSTEPRDYPCPLDSRGHALAGERRGEPKKACQVCLLFIVIMLTIVVSALFVRAASPLGKRAKMTENPGQPTSDSYPASSSVPPTTPAPSTSRDGTATTSEVVRDEVANVAGQAAGASQNVAATAKEEVANVASEVKTSTRDLMNQAKSDLTSQAATQQQKAAEGIHTISSQLRTMADAPDEQGVASDLIRQAADRSASVASWLEHRDPGSLLDEVKSFARQRPGTFLLLAAGAGMVAGRLGRSLQAGAPTAAPRTGTALPPQQVQSPATDSGIAYGAGAPVYGETTSAVPAYGETVYGEPARPAFDGPGTGSVPLRDPNDPFVQGEGRQP